MKKKYTIKQIKEIGQETKRLSYDNWLQKMTLKYGRWLPRIMSPYLTWFLLKVFPGISPNFVSGLMILVCLAAHWILIKGYFLPGGLLLYLSILLDKSDGEIARLKEKFSYSGVFLDSQFHFIYWLYFTVISINLYRNGSGDKILVMGAVATVLGIYHRYTRTSYKKAIFKISPHLRDIKEVKYVNIKNTYLNKIFSFLKIMYREDMSAIFLILFSAAGLFSPGSVALYIFIYFWILVCSAIMVFFAGISCVNSTDSGSRRT